VRSLKRGGSSMRGDGGIDRVEGKRKTKVSLVLRRVKQENKVKKIKRE
jgi:hypothetical protein